MQQLHIMPPSSFNIHLTLSSRLFLELQNRFFPFRFTCQKRDGFLPLPHTWHISPYLIPLHWITRMIFGEQFEPRRPPLCSSLQSPARPPYLPQNQFSKTLRLCSFLKRDQVSNPYEAWGILIVEICALLGHHAAHGGNILPTFLDNLSVAH